MSDPVYVVACLLDRDGSARDLNFEAPAWSGLEELLTDLKREFTDIEMSACGEDGNEFHVADVATAVSGILKRRGSLHVSLRGGREFVRNLQVFAGHDNGPAPFVELTFFPDDVAQSADLHARFTAWMGRVQRTLQASRAFARYEGASWQLGDVSASSGVFFVSGPQDESGL